MKPPARSPNPAAFPLPLPRPGWAALPLAPAGPPEPPLWTIDDHLAAAERQMDGLRHEMDALRRRDATVHHAMRRLDEELRLAAKLQQDFLPKALPAVGPVRFHAVWRPAGYVSGDLYDVARLDEDHVGFYIADAVGHGVPAALLTMFIKNALVRKEIRPGGYRLLDPGESLARLNASLVAQQLQTGTFCTACCATLNVRTLELRIASAGHPAPTLLRGDADPAVLRTDGSLLGIFDDEPYATTVHQLARGDRLVLFTDGVEVAFGEQGEAAEPATARWHAELATRRDLGGADLAAALADRIDGEPGSLDPRDDLTVLVAEIT